MKPFAKQIILITLFALTEFCSSGQQKDTASMSVKSSSEIDKYFLLEPVEDEAFRVYASSDDYNLQQTGFSESMILVADASKRNPVGEEIKAYDLVDVFTEGVYKVELFKDSGLISHIRPVKPAHISEINKIIADDITRFKFKFKDEKKIEPLTFKIRYGVKLHKKKSQEEIKKILKENVRE